MKKILKFASKELEATTDVHERWYNFSYFNVDSANKKCLKLLFRLSLNLKDMDFNSLKVKWYYIV